MNVTLKCWCEAVDRVYPCSPLMNTKFHCDRWILIGHTQKQDGCFINHRCCLQFTMFFPARYYNAIVDTGLIRRRFAQLDFVTFWSLALRVLLHFPQTTIIEWGCTKALYIYRRASNCTKERLLFKRQIPGLVYIPNWIFIYLHSQEIW